MLILTRKPGEALYIGDSITVSFLDLQGHAMRIGVDAPKNVEIWRDELYNRIKNGESKGNSSKLHPFIEEWTKDLRGRPLPF